MVEIEGHCSNYQGECTMKIKRGTRWYMYSKDAHTNEVIAEALDGLNSVEKFSNLECENGDRLPLCEAPDYNFVARLWRSRATLQIDFEIFRSQGNGKPSPWQFPIREKTTLQKLIKKGDVQPAWQMKRIVRF
jgi:hypothetical protein